MDDVPPPLPLPTSPTGTAPLPGADTAEGARAVEHPDPQHPDPQHPDLQHEESFVVRLLMEGNAVRSTSARHSRGGIEARWPSWAPTNLTTFIEAHLTHVMPGVRHDPQADHAGSGTGPAPGGAHLHARVEPAAPRAGSPFDIWLALRVGGQTLPPWGSLDYFAVARVDPVDVPGAEGNGKGSGGGIDVESVGTGAPVRQHPPLHSQGAVLAPSVTIHLASPGLPAGHYSLTAAISLRIPGVRRPLGVTGAGRATFEVRSH
ncbi:hypothetical protein [Parafrankia elaeagni]|uniref:hypothetical protein n=1 Tax=Parafrankia elaeagni TaxID=222534 RepID=UPI00037DE35F|nr:hypothetical protein [Parafrankia elaeagni]